MSQVRSGDQVKIHYTGRVLDGAVFGSTKGEQPIEFVTDSPNMLPGLSQAVMGMQVGDKKTVTIPPERAFGHRQEDLQQRLPVTALPAGAKVGDRLLAETNGQQRAIWVRGVEGETAVLDGNHPLAGQTLEFEIELLAIQRPA